MGSLTRRGGDGETDIYIYISQWENKNGIQWLNCQILPSRKLM
jgi:hypothetical protein